MLTLSACCFFIIGLNTFKRQKQPLQTKSTLYFNGTDYFDTTVIFISLDGFRNDYLERKVTPNIESIALQGIRAEHMYPSFPSITFPNHWTLATGLYPEAHGIVANEFYDPILKEEYIHKKPDISGNAKWWGGEPIWITSTNQGKRSGVMMWPGSDVAIQSKRPDMYIPYTRNVTARDKMDMTLDWLDMPREERPQSISVYIPRVDQKGHGGGPDGKGMNTILVEMDDAIGHLMKGLEKRNLDSHVHLVIVSDHGMAGTDKSTLIFFDKIFSPESLSYMREREAWPLLGIRANDDAPEDAIDKIYYELEVYTETHPNPHFQFYKREDIPERYHYKSTERIAPIIMIPDVGYAIIETKDYDVASGKDFRPRGIHGYDNLAYEMRAIFMAKGPKVNYAPGTVVKPFFNTEVYQFLTNLLDLEAAPNNATLNGDFV
ncbi:Phosphodiest-domain-containing protein [Backusella circina FSU 941]|nr:Phosphodiest-domain-containing protein [Backusella circina FSU 941]